MSPRPLTWIAVSICAAGCPDNNGNSTDSPTTAASSGSTTSDLSESGGTMPGPGSSSTGPGSTGPGSTGTGSTGPGSTGTGSTGPGSTGPGSTGTGSTGPGSTGTGSTGPGSTGASSDGTSTGDASTGDASTGEDTGGEQEPVCSSVLWHTYENGVQIEHGGAQIMTLGGSHLVLWDQATLAPITYAYEVARAMLVGGRLVYERGGLLHVVDAPTGVTLAQCPAAPVWGVARDASYLWAGSAGGLEVLELDCTPRWSVKGDATGAKGLALPDALHVFAPNFAPNAVFRFDALSGVASQLPFVGTFGQWFGDVPRFWSTQSEAYRLYDTDGKQLSFAIGAPKHGWGVHLVMNNRVYNVAALDVPLVDPHPYKISGPALFGGNPWDSSIIRLDTDPPQVIPLNPPLDSIDWTSFGWSSSGWALGDWDGFVRDQLGRVITHGPFRGLAGAPVGRLAAGDDVRARAFDVGEGCSTVAHPFFARKGGAMWMTGNGSLLLSSEHLQNPFTRLYSMPAGVDLGGVSIGPFNLKFLKEYDASDDGAVWARLWGNYDSTDVFEVFPFPLAPKLFSGDSDVAAKVAPDGQHVATSDVFDWNDVFLSDGKTYIFDPIDLYTLFEGVPRGFLDPSHILLAHYAEPDVFMHSEVVDLDGLVVQVTTLPDIERFTRLGTGEILAQLRPSGAAIFDVATGEALWTAPPDVEVAVASKDHVVLHDKETLTLIKWR